jgi:hypothetical protein
MAGGGDMRDGTPSSLRMRGPMSDDDHAWVPACAGMTAFSDAKESLLFARPFAAVG